MNKRSVFFICTVLLACFCSAVAVAKDVVIVQVYRGDTNSDINDGSSVTALVNSLNSGNLSLGKKFYYDSVNTWSAAISYQSSHPTRTVYVIGHGAFDTLGFTGFLSDINGSKSTLESNVKSYFGSRSFYCGVDGNNLPITTGQIGSRIAQVEGATFLSGSQFSWIFDNDKREFFQKALRSPDASPSKWLSKYGYWGTALSYHDYSYFDVTYGAGW